MKKLLPLILLICSNVLFAQEPKPFSIEYDKFKDKTTVRYINTDKWKDIAFIAGARFDGQQPASDPAVSFSFYFGCKYVCFRSEPSLIVLADGERITIPSSVHHIDSVLLIVSRAQLDRIANAKLAEFQIGSYESTFTLIDKENFKNVLVAASAKK